MKIKFYKDKDSFSFIDVAPNSTAADLATTLNLTAPNQALAVAINNEPKDLTASFQENDEVRFIDFATFPGEEIFWHTSAHVLAQAVLRKFPQAIPTIGPAIENGFYYDFANLQITEADLEVIEEEMKKICKENFKPERCVLPSKKEALTHFQHNRYKKEMIENFVEGEKISAYHQGEFFDLCRGPHLPSLGKIKAIKILKTSGAYWKGDSKNEMLTRIYGISFPDPKLLKDYIAKIEEAKKRDHKILGPKLDLFSLHEEAPGIPFLHHKGMIIWNRLIDFSRRLQKKAGYIEIRTPTIMTKELWVRSGHWTNYADNMFFTTREDREFAIKPMSCPGAMIYYKEKQYSYRDLPLRVSEYGFVHRFEPSGSLSGLFRVRSFHQDDAHIFAKLSDIQDEMSRLIKLVEEIYEPFGMEYEFVLSTRPEKQTIGSDEAWEISTEGLRSALIAANKPFTVDEGGGAFYGPKIDLKVHDALGRSWQCATIQLDMSLPEKFDLEYTDQNGIRQRPIIIHRAIFGSVERFFGSLIEWYAGKFPLWISPSQIYIVAVAERHVSYADSLKDKFEQFDFEVEVDRSNESVSKKIREAQMGQYNYILTVGDKEMENKTIALRTRDNVMHGEMALEPFLEAIINERNTKAAQSPFTK